MDLSRIFSSPGVGVFSTASSDGIVNSAIYSRPHVIDHSTLVWGMTDGRTWQNLATNPHAAFLYKTDAPGFSGVRLTLEMIKSDEGGELLAAIRENTDRIVGQGTGAAVTHAVWFRVVEIRPLI